MLQKKNENDSTFTVKIMRFKYLTIEGDWRSTNDGRDFSLSNYFILF